MAEPRPEAPQIGQPWYYSNISEERAGKTFRRVRPPGPHNGDFIVYDNPLGYPGMHYFVMVLVNRRPRKSPVSKRIDGKYVVGPDNDQQSRRHSSVESLIEYHKHHPLPLEEGGTVILGQGIVPRNHDANDPTVDEDFSFRVCLDEFFSRCTIL